MSTPSKPELQSDEGPRTLGQANRDRLASLGTLVASVAHEVNNPITYVLGNLGELERLAHAMRESIEAYRSAVQERPACDAKIEQLGGLELIDELFADTLEGALRIRDLVRDLLTLSRPAERHTDLINVHEVLDSSLRLANRQIAAAAALEREYTATNWVQGDRAQLGGVFLNLVTNAVDACQPPDAELHRIRILTRNADEGVEIEIWDTGVGVLPEHRDRIFAKFFTTKGMGTGLGLYISRRIVHDQGGQLDFRSAPGGGTIFSVRLQGQGEHSSQQPSEEPGSASGGGSRRS